MNRIAICLIAILLMAFSCEDDIITTCNTNDPLEELDWLKEIKNNLELSNSAAGFEIIQYSYQGNDVFWVDDCYQCPDGLIQVYDCAGAVICEFGGIDGRNTCTDFDTAAYNRYVLLDGVNRTVLKGVLSYTGMVAADGCEWLLETDSETFSLKDYAGDQTSNPSTVLVEYQETDENFSCGLMPTVYPQIIALSVCEIGELTLDKDAYDNAPIDFLNINSLTITDNTLKIIYGSSGCSGDSWELKLIDSEAIMESFPPQRNLKLSLKNQEDCQAYFVKEICFDIRALQTDGNQVILNITNTDNEILYSY
jgi:hypothetical protein